MVEEYEFTPTGVKIKEGLTYAEWKRVLERAVGVDRAGPWVVGDCILYGEDHYGQKYTQALAETGLSPERLRVIAWVTSRYPISERRISLSFESHREVASLAGEERNQWLDRAERAGWSSRELREELRGAGAGNRCAGRTTYQCSATFDEPLAGDAEAELREELESAAWESHPVYVKWTKRNG